ncbi:hypothetical protein HY029_01490, partial [Candidatus Gottesmanbacteria bacterium]|nr:hypothetical protein [Candidatus Gottesmanbacteria bacterium]
MNDINFARNLTKGKIAETIFWMMFREDERFILLPFGYEYTIPELTHYRKYLKDSIKTVEKISSSPDFIMLSSDKSQLYIVDVKYRTTLSDRLKLNAEKTFEKWEECYYFVATPEGFYFDTCKSIVQNNGKISSLSDTLVS